MRAQWKKALENGPAQQRREQRPTHLAWRVTREGQVQQVQVIARMSPESGLAIVKAGGEGTILTRANQLFDNRDEAILEHAKRAVRR